MSPFPSDSRHPLRRWALTIVLTAVVFFGLNGLMDVLAKTDREAEYAALVAERNAVKDLAQSIKQQNLCGVIAYLVDRSNASLPTIEYYKDHPDELEAAQAANRETLRILNCDPISPPPPVELIPREIEIYRGRN